MSRLAFNKSVVYYGEDCLGELDVIPNADNMFQFPNDEIRIHHISPISEHCLPLSVLLSITISSLMVCCKLESSSSPATQLLLDLHASCFYELKTAVVLIGDEEVHLVAMPSKLRQFPCFWCCVVPAGLYDACLGMLNTRCLSIVFDLDNTLIVANTMKSFDDRIESLAGWIGQETDPVRLSGMMAERKRYVEDRDLLKQYVESDSVSDGGNTYSVKMEEVSVYAAGHECIQRPVIRLPEKNVVLTRINPELRDTSVLVRLRPAWQDLRSYLIADGRKRFEVYVCTMAERDYALEMWRLLDPEAHLIDPKQLLTRVVCVKSDAQKSLLNVFQDRTCHPRMAMVIDDRLKVWEENDQPRVHVVPAFAPYYAPQAETVNAVPVLCVARNVACNVRSGFFKDFYENLIRRVAEHFYEDEVLNLPSAPDVFNYLMSEDAIPVGALQKIGQICGSKVEYRPILSNSREWQFSYEVLMTGEKIGVGMGKTRKDARQQAAENAIRSLAEKYESYIISRSESVNKDSDNHPNETENGFLWETDSDDSPVEDAENSSEVDIHIDDASYIPFQLKKN